MNDKCMNIEIKQQLNEQVLDIYHLIEIADLLRKNPLELKSLIDPNGGKKWENIAMMLPYLPLEMIEENIDHLLEGFMDLNWLGSRVLYAYLPQLDIRILKPALNRVIHHAIDLNDDDWIYFINSFLENESLGMTDFYREEIDLSKNYLVAKRIYE